MKKRSKYYSYYYFLCRDSDDHLSLLLLLLKRDGGKAVQYMMETCVWSDMMTLLCVLLAGGEEGIIGKLLEKNWEVL